MVTSGNRLKDGISGFTKLVQSRVFNYFLTTRRDHFRVNVGHRVPVLFHRFRNELNPIGSHIVSRRVGETRVVYNHFYRSLGL